MYVVNSAGRLKFIFFTNINEVTSTFFTLECIISTYC